MTKYTVVYHTIHDYDVIDAVLVGEHNNQISTSSLLIVEAEDASHACTVATKKLIELRAPVLPWITVDKILEKTRELGVPDADVLYWMISPTAYWEEQDEPYNHFDDSEGMLKAAVNHFDQVW